MPQRIDMLSSLYDLHLSSYPNLTEYKKAISLIREAQTARNTFLHSIIGVETDNPTRGKIAKVSARGTLKQNLESIELVDLKEASDKIHRAAQALYKLILAPLDT